MTQELDENFYEAMDGFRNFSGITDDNNFQSIPDDWSVMVTDVRNSADAIEEGRYRDVNKIGAATMAVLHRRLDNVELPYVFGGDGASMVVPPVFVKDAREELAGLKQLARENFDLDLRTASVSVRTIVDKGLDLEVGKLEIVKSQSITIFRGGGLKWVENETKRNREDYEIQSDAPDSTELEGLSCRWKPIPNKRGEILSVLVLTLSDEPSRVYESILDEFDRILEGGLEQTNPVNTTKMTYKSLFECLHDEVRYQNSIVSMAFVSRVLEIFLAIAVFRLGLNLISVDPDEYLKSLETHSDYRKFDDMLRLVMDCSPEESTQIKQYLSELRDQGEIVFGLHTSEEALMTCYVDDLNEGGHVHFIDGGQGGYSLASEQLKQQLNEIQRT